MIRCLIILILFFVIHCMTYKLFSVGMVKRVLTNRKWQIGMASNKFMSGAGVMTCHLQMARA